MLVLIPWTDNVVCGIPNSMDIVDDSDNGSFLEVNAEFETPNLK